MESEPTDSDTPTQPILISQADDAAPGQQSLRSLVGSPENMSTFHFYSAHTTPFTISETPSEVPRDTDYFVPHGASPSPATDEQLLTRSVTLPGSSTIGRRRTPSVVQGVARRLFRSSSSNQQRPEREWTVFGEIMGSETGGDAPQDRTSGGNRPRNVRDLFNASHTTSYRASVAPQVPSIHEPPMPSSESPSAPAVRPHPSTSSINQSLLPEHEPSSPHPSAPQKARRMSSSSSEITVTAKSGNTDTRRPWYKIPEIPRLYKNILKCSIAYFIGSLFTFCPYLSQFIIGLSGSGPGDRTPSPSGHMVATIAVYFNPAKTLGGMLEADAFCGMGLLFAAFVSLSSMSMYWFFEVKPGMEWLADSLVILWVGIAMSIIAWMKMWMAKPAFNTACSMTSIILFTVVVKEGGWETLLQVALIVFVGSAISNLVCHTLWPQRATRNLQATMTKTLTSFSTLLTMITETFLLEEPLLLVSQEKLQAATKNHQNSFTALKKDLTEAQSERFWGGPGKVKATNLLEETGSRKNLGRAYEDAIDSLNRLGQHLNGLRSGISVQYELIKASRGGKLTLRRTPSKAQFSAFEEEVNRKGNIVVDSTDCRSDEERALLQAAADSFGEIVDDLGPPLKALSTNCRDTLKRLREAFNDRGEKDLKPEEFQEMAEDLERALYTFESTSNHAVVRLYRRGTASASESISSLAEDNLALTGSESESIFLVYFFFFTLQEFAKELNCLVDAMSRICDIQRQNSKRKSLKDIWRFLSRGQISRVRARELTRNRTLSKRISAYFFHPEPIHRAVSFPKVTPHAPNTKQTPAREELSLMGQFNQSLWALGAWLKQSDIKYAFKTGMATAMLAAPAFFESTRPVFVEYRGEWALISFFVVISPTIGATNFMGLHRVLGTLFGALTSVAIWTAFPENPYVLSIFGFFFSMPCFYYIVAKPEYATSARFVLLTYNLTCLYSYNLRQHDISIINIAFHRATAVTVGVVWAALVSRYWWPIEARRELSKALGEFCLNIGWLYTRLVAFNSFENGRVAITETTDGHVDERTALLRSTGSYVNESIMEFMAMELHLQIKLIELQGLLAQTQHEPRLKGPFPVKLYRSMLTSLQTILDKLHSMRCVTSREEWHTTVCQDFIMPTNKQRREMVGNVILYFSVLASAFRVKSPLPPYLPPAETARQRLVEVIRQLDVVKNRDVKGSRQLLFFAYALTMQGVIRELDFLGRTLQDTFGVIGESTEAFETLFRDTAHEVV